jgi:hypothetical protein
VHGGISGLIQLLRRQMQEGHKFEANLGKVSDILSKTKIIIIKGLGLWLKQWNACQYVQGPGANSQCCKINNKYINKQIFTVYML